MLEKKTSVDLAYLADDHVVITTYTWVEEDGVRITENSRSMEQIQRLQKDLHLYPENVMNFAVMVWEYSSIEDYDAARSALIASQE